MPTFSPPPSIAELPCGRHVAYRVYGDPQGRPVLALHGTPATSRMFGVADNDARAAGLKLVAPDRPGYGATALDQKPTLATRAADLAQFVNALGIERLGILGVSGGGPYAIALAAALGARVDTLALVAPVGPFADPDLAGRLSHIAHGLFLDMPQKHPRLLEMGTGLAATVFRLMPGVVSRTVASLSGSADAIILTRPHVEAVMIAMTREALAHGTEGVLADADVYSRAWEVDFAAIKARTIIWQGADDHIVPPHSAELLAAVIPGAVLNRIKHAGHFWIFDHVATVLAELRGPVSAAAG